MTDSVLIVGATSSMAQAICHELAARGHQLILAGRDQAELELLASDIAVRHKIHSHIVVADLLSPRFSPVSLIEQAGNFAHMVLAAGDMGDDSLDVFSIDWVTRINYTIPAMIASLAAESLVKKGDGSIVIISSVAGDRGRQSNYMYGSAKAGLTAFASGLRNRYFARGVHVMTVKPGFTDTPMTWGMNSPLIASRESVAKAIVNAMEKKKDVIYAPFFWRYIMLAIIHIPEMLFKRLKL